MIDRCIAQVSYTELVTGNEDVDEQDDMTLDVLPF